MEKYCRLCISCSRSRLIKLDLDEKNEGDDEDVPLEMVEKGSINSKQNIFTLMLTVVYQVCFEFGEFFYKMQIFSIKCYNVIFFYIIFNLISFNHYNGPTCSCYSFLSQLSFQTWCKYLKEIHFNNTEVLIKINDTKRAHYIWADDVGWG